MPGVSNSPTTGVHKTSLEVSCPSEIFPSIQEPSWPLKWSSVPAPAVPTTLQSTGGSLFTWAKWVFHPRGELFLPLQPRGLLEQEDKPSCCHCCGPVCCCTSGLWGPHSLALSDHALPTARTCRSVWQVVLSMESLEHTVGGHSQTGHSQPFPGMRTPGEMERAPDEPLLQGRAPNEFTGEGGLRSQCPVSRSSWQLVRALPGPP